MKKRSNSRKPSQTSALSSNVNEKKVSTTHSNKSSIKTKGSLNASNDTKKKSNSYHLTDRVMKDVPYPATQLLSIKQVFDETADKPKISVLKDHFVREGRLDEAAALKLINDAKTLMTKEQNLLYLTDPVIIVGDIHGQFYDLLKALDMGGDPADNKYLFLGDYVDRGHFSIEVLLYLFAFKILYPNTFILLRGNHECRHLTEHFTFRRECIIKYSINIYEMSCKAFDAMPLVAIVSSRFLCVHGGISPESCSIDDIMRINRFRETPQSGQMCDLLWSDPCSDFGSEEHSGVSFINNSNRGCSYHYTYHAVTKFLKNNQLLSIIRAHEAQMSGFKMYKKINNTNFPSLITIFSAPNYLDVYDNKGAIIKYENNVVNTKQYNAVPHPYWLPNFMDVFTWSLPFIVEKVTEMLVHILNIIDDDEDDEDISPEKRNVIKQKILTIGRFCIFFAKVRQDSENVLNLKGITPSTVSPLNHLVSGSRRSSLPPETTEQLGQAINQRRLSFEEAKELDKVNEQFPMDNVR